jgi:hypothetical protein
MTRGASKDSAPQFCQTIPAWLLDFHALGWGLVSMSQNGPAGVTGARESTAGREDPGQRSSERRGKRTSHSPRPRVPPARGVRQQFRPLHFRRYAEGFAHVQEGVGPGEIVRCDPAASVSVHLAPDAVWGSAKPPQVLFRLNEDALG